MVTIDNTVHASAAERFKPEQNGKVRLSATANVVQFDRAAARGPQHQKRNAPPRRMSNASVRTREYLTPDEVAALEHAARSTGRLGIATQLSSLSRIVYRGHEMAKKRWDSRRQPINFKPVLR